MRFDDRVTGKLNTYAIKAKKIHVEIDRAEINKNVPVDIPPDRASREFLAPGGLPESPPAFAWLTQIHRSPIRTAYVTARFC